jgi:hypothetical protein
MALGVGKIAQRMGGKRGPADRRFGGMGGGDACRRTPVGAHQFTRPAFYMTAVGVAVLLNAGGLKPPQPTLAPARPAVAT